MLTRRDRMLPFRRVANRYICDELASRNRGWRYLRDRGVFLPAGDLEGRSENLRAHEFGHGDGIDGSEGS